MPHWSENLEAITQLYHKTSVMYIQPSRETKLLAKIKRRKERERREKKDYLYCNTGPEKWKEKNTMEKFLQTIKGGGEKLRMGLVLQDKYRIYSIVRAVFGGF